MFLLPVDTPDSELKLYKESIKALLAQSTGIIPPDIIDTKVDSLTQQELNEFLLSLDKTINILGSQEILNVTVSKGLFEQQAKIDDLMKQTEASRIALAKEINLILGDGPKKMAMHEI